jgi:hypothetical protein
VAIIPVTTLGLDPAEGRHLERALRRETNQRPTARAAPPARVSAALDRVASDGSCAESEECLARAGRAVPADLVLSCTLAGLGNTRVIRARLLRCGDAVVLQDLQQTIAGQGTTVLDEAAVDLGRRLFPAPPGRPWYRKWWVWTAAAAVIGGTVAVIVWAASTPDDPGRDPALVHIGDL